MRLLLASLVLSYLVVHPALARAESAPVAPAPVEAEETSWLPHLGLHLGSGYPGLFAVSASLRWPRRLFVDVGAWAFPFIGDGVYGRAAYPLALYDGREGRVKGWELTLPLGLGGQFTTFACCGNEQEFIAGEATVGIDATRWVFPRFGFNLQASGGVALGRSKQTEIAGEGVNGKPEFRAEPIVRLGVGVVF